MVRPCILEIDSQKELGALLDITNDKIKFRLHERETEVNYQQSTMPRMEVEYICSIAQYQEQEQAEEHEILWREAQEKIENVELE